MIQEFLRRLAVLLSKELDTAVNIGSAEPDDSVNLFLLPDSTETLEFMDGTKRARMRLELSVKDKSHKRAIALAEKAHALIDNLDKVGNLRVNDLIDNEYPYLVGKTDDLQYVYAVRTGIEIER